VTQGNDARKRIAAAVGRVVAVEKAALIHHDDFVLRPAQMAEVS